MTERDLHVQDHGDHVADQYKGDATSRRGYTLVDDNITVPCPKEDLPGYLQPTMPPCNAFSRSTPKDEVLPAKDIQVKSPEQHDRIVQMMLESNEELSRAIICHDSIVVG